MNAVIANSLSARCAGACPSARKELRRKKRRMAGVGRSVRRFPQKWGRKKRKEGEFRKKVHKFLFNLSPPSKNEIFFSQKIRPFETKVLLLRLIKHNFPFIPPPCGVHIAQSRGTFPDPPAQTLFDLLNPSRLRLIPSYRDRPQRRCPSQSGDIYTTATRPLGFVRIGVCRERRRSKGLSFFHKKGALAFFGQRAFGLPHSLHVLPRGGESDHHYLTFGGLLFEKENPKSYAKRLRVGFFCSFEVYRTAINGKLAAGRHRGYAHSSLSRSVGRLI